MTSIHVRCTFCGSELPVHAPRCICRVGKDWVGVAVTVDERALRADDTKAALEVARQVVRQATPDSEAAYPHAYSVARALLDENIDAVRWRTWKRYILSNSTDADGNAVDAAADNLTAHFKRLDAEATQ